MSEPYILEPYMPETELPEVAAEQGPAATVADHGLRATLDRIRVQRRRIAVRAARLRVRGIICGNGIGGFFRDHGIPLDGYCSVAEAQRWDGNLRNLHRYSDWAGNMTDLMLLMDEKSELDLSCYTETGLQRISDQVSDQHQFWITSIRNAAVRGQQSGHYTFTTMSNALTSVGIDPPAKIVTAAVKAVWDLPASTKLNEADRKRLEAKISAAMVAIPDAAEQGILAENLVITIDTSERVQ